MRYTRDIEKEEFKKIEIGELFEYSDIVYMKIQEIKVDDDDDFMMYANAITIADGFSHEFEDNELCRKLNYKLTIMN